MRKLSEAEIITVDITEFITLNKFRVLDFGEAKYTMYFNRITFELDANHRTNKNAIVEKSKGYVIHLEDERYNTKSKLYVTDFTESQIFELFGELLCGAHHNGEFNFENTHFELKPNSLEIIRRN